MQKSASGSPSTTLPLSRAERLRRYRRGPGPGKRYPYCIRLRGEQVNALVKRGYLGANEVDDLEALKQAFSLFVWDNLRVPKRPRLQVRGARFGKHQGNR